MDKSTTRFRERPFCFIVSSVSYFGRDMPKKSRGLSILYTHLLVSEYRLQTFGLGEGMRSCRRPLTCMVVKGTLP